MDLCAPRHLFGVISYNSPHLNVVCLAPCQNNFLKTYCQPFWIFLQAYFIPRIARAGASKIQRRLLQSCFMSCQHTETYQSISLSFKMLFSAPNLLKILKSKRKSSCSALRPSHRGLMPSSQNAHQLSFHKYCLAWPFSG